MIQFFYTRKVYNFFAKVASNFCKFLKKIYKKSLRNISKAFLFFYLFIFGLNINDAMYPHKRAVEIPTALAVKPPL